MQPSIGFSGTEYSDKLPGPCSRIARPRDTSKRQRTSCPWNVIRAWRNLGSVWVCKSVLSA